LETFRLANDRRYATKLISVAKTKRPNGKNKANKIQSISGIRPFIFSCIRTEDPIAASITFKVKTRF